MARDAWQAIGQGFQRAAPVIQELAYQIRRQKILEQQMAQQQEQQAFQNMLAVMNHQLREKQFQHELTQAQQDKKMKMLQNLTAQGDTPEEVFNYKYGDVGWDSLQNIPPAQMATQAPGLLRFLQPAQQQEQQGSISPDEYLRFLISYAGKPTEQTTEELTEGGMKSTTIKRPMGISAGTAAVDSALANMANLYGGAKQQAAQPQAETGERSFNSYNEVDKYLKANPDGLSPEEISQYRSQAKQYFGVE